MGQSLPFRCCNLMADFNGVVFCFLWGVNMYFGIVPFYSLGWLRFALCLIPLCWNYQLGLLLLYWMEMFNCWIDQKLNHISGFVSPFADSIPWSFLFAVSFFIWNIDQYKTKCSSCFFSAYRTTADLKLKNLFFKSIYRFALALLKLIPRFAA